MSRVNERRSILPLSGKERGSSPGDADGIRPFGEQRVPVGLERLLGMAAADPDFARALWERRAEALAASGVTLTPAEEAVLAATPEVALRQMVASVDGRLADRDRRAFLASAGAALLLLAGCEKKRAPESSAAQGPAPQPRPVATPPATMRPEPAPGANTGTTAGPSGIEGPGPDRRPMSPVVALTGSRPGRVPTLPRERRVRLGPGKVRGKLDKTIVRRVLRRHLAAFEHCHVSGSGEAPKPGALWVSFAITGQGKTRRVTVSRGGLSARIGKCVAKAVGRVVYPAPEDAKVVQVRWKLIFK